ncbi:type I-E CRISPR-associated endonuclease Cas1e [Nesterenkonia aerolata]|uniref:CRISPR-associated endonuclease Cas1 n=1 Tax=Nesterenkonia aerolata TaxID=3074079 RepID=A0ABU2DSF9_9MICC|nr:type I-E CRISPR-associated endonuclease Cas1e [Nesterenkonia sp. LY-0111]MDR8019341.1 type I-E CRISPR-associated endonuclease Cas1e [Nesterenkonia sp. LY-0111]
MPTELLRVEDRISFVYLERAVVHRDENAITSTDEDGTVHIPAAGIGCLLLGPGTRISHAAIALLGDCGVSVVWAGEKGVRLYAHGSSIAKNNHLLVQQARLVSNTRSRLRVARHMYQMRFPGEDVSRLSMHQLRGREGVRVRRIYAAEARRVGLKWSGRNYKPGQIDASNPVNQALTAANAALYGIVHSVISGLGCSPGLGFVHSGTSRSFVYDIADLYKAETSIPASFDAAASGDESLTTSVRRRLRDSVVETRLLERCAHDLYRLFSPEQAEHDTQAERNEDSLHLWGEDGSVPAGRSYGTEP